MTLAEAWQEEHPGTTPDEARAALVEARLEATELERATQAEAEKRGYIDPAAPAGAADKVADTALNGAQVTSLVEIIRAVNAGEMPPATAAQIISVAFQLPADRAVALVGDSGAMPMPAQEEAEAEGEQESEQGDAGEEEEMDDEDEPTGEVDMSDVHEMVLDALDDGDIEAAKKILKGRNYAVSSS